MRAPKSPPAIKPTPRSNSFTGWVIVRALNTEPRITKTQIEMNTATVTSRVRAALARTASFGLMPRASTPRYWPLLTIGTNTSVTWPSGLRCWRTKGLWGRFARSAGISRRRLSSSSLPPWLPLIGMPR